MFTDGGRSSLPETLGAKITSIATIFASPYIGQTRVAEVGLESGFYRYMFCDSSKYFSACRHPAAGNLYPQIALVTVLFGLSLVERQTSLGQLFCSFAESCRAVASRIVSNADLFDFPNADVIVAPGISGCSGSSVTPPTATTPAAQIYTIVVTATDTMTKAQSSTTLTLSVQ